MNTLVQSFSTTGPSAELRKTQRLADEEEAEYAMWGSQAGFGSLSKGVPSFSVPSVPDVRSLPCVVRFV